MKINFFLRISSHLMVWSNGLLSSLLFRSDILLVRAQHSVREVVRKTYPTIWFMCLTGMLSISEFCAVIFCALLFTTQNEKTTVRIVGIAFVIHESLLDSCDRSSNCVKYWAGYQFHSYCSSFSKGTGIQSTESIDIIIT